MGVLRGHLGGGAPMGVKFMEGIGSLYRSGSTSHWINIVRIVCRMISYSWHQDTGRCLGGDTRTVLLGFPREDSYNGCKAISHAVKLKCKQHTPGGHLLLEPIANSTLALDKAYLVRPRFVVGHNIVAFCNVDVLHLAPDVTYQTSFIRAM